LFLKISPRHKGINFFEKKNWFYFLKRQSIFTPNQIHLFIVLEINRETLNKTPLFLGKNVIYHFLVSFDSKETLLSPASDESEVSLYIITACSNIQVM